MDLTGKTYIITGASKGLGKVICDFLKSYNANVISLSHSKCDITNEEDVKNLFINNQNINGVVNCACLCMDNDYREKSSKEFLEVLNTNLVGTFLIDKYASLYMKNGTIINVSSLDSINTFNSYSMDYCASKAGVNNLTLNFASADLNNKYMAIAPAWIDTEAVLEMDKHFLEKEMKKNGQKELLKKENVALKVIDMLTNDSYHSGDIIIMEE